MQTIKKRPVSQTIPILLLLLMAFTACQAANPRPAASQTPPTAAPLPTATLPVPLRQWASRAEASSALDVEFWPASHAAGAPDTPACSMEYSAWMVAPGDLPASEWLLVYFSQPVQPQQLNIHISFNPSLVTQVELLDIGGTAHTVYEGQPFVEETCPFVQEVQIPAADYFAYAARITLFTGAWEHYLMTAIDAVELVGLPSPQALSTPTARPTQATTSLGLRPSSVPAGHFYFELFDDDPRYSDENDTVQWNFSANDNSFTLIGSDLKSAITLRLPLNLQTGRFELKPFSTVHFEPPSGNLMLDQQTYYFTGGSIVIDDFSTEHITGSLEFSAESTAEPGRVLNGMAVFNHIPLGYVDDSSADTLLRQWAARAEASSEQPGHAALKAAGKTDTFYDCSEASNAWVPAASSGGEWLEVYYDRPVRPHVLNILLTSLPGAVAQVNLMGLEDFYPLDMGSVEFIDGCPVGLVFTILEEVPFDIYGVQIIFNYAESGLRPAVDAVELVGTPADGAGLTTDLLTSWAVGAEATTQDEASGGVAQAASGPPDAPACGTFGTAWKPGSAEYPAQLTLYYYDQPLIPTEIRVILSNHPSQVVQVEVLDAYSQHPDAVVYQASPQALLECPYTLVIPVQGIDYPVMGVLITLQRADRPANDTEVDAVQLVGRP